LQFNYYFSHEQPSFQTSRFQRISHSYQSQLEQIGEILSFSAQMQMEQQKQLVETH
jgi:hypothetical protein